jgi:hypothetical protein
MQSVQQCDPSVTQEMHTAACMFSCEASKRSTTVNAFIVCLCLQGDGFITNKQAVESWGISTPSDMFTTPLTEWVGPSVRLEHGDAQVRSSISGC